MLNTMIEEGFLGKIGKFMSSVVGKLKNVISKIKNQNVSEFTKIYRKDLIDKLKKI